PDEQRQLVAVTGEATTNATWLIVGTGGESTRQTIALTKAAAAEGADAVLVRAPSYFSAQTTTASLVAHFHAVADASPVPVLIYNIPKYTRLALDPAMLQQLADHEQIVGVKAAMDAVGLYGGPVRPPLAPLSAADRERVSALVRGD